MYTDQFSFFIFIFIFLGISNFLLYLDMRWNRQNIKYLLDDLYQKDQELKWLKSQINNKEN